MSKAKLKYIEYQKYRNELGNLSPCDRFIVDGDSGMSRVGRLSNDRGVGMVKSNFLICQCKTWEGPNLIA